MRDLMKLARAAAEAARKAETSPATDAKLPAKACVTCAHFRPKPGQTPDGWCTRHKVETWGQYADGCADDWTPAGPAARALEQRRAAVVARLEADPALRYAFAVSGASPGAPAERDVSVMLGLRDSSGRIVAGELRIPADRWPGVAVFAAHWRDSDGRPS